MDASGANLRPFHSDSTNKGCTYALKHRIMDAQEVDYGPAKDRAIHCREEKRRERNLTQAELAEKIGVSNKSVSKWENGKCMPDYAVIKPLCRELEINVTDLLNGELSPDQEKLNAQTLSILSRIETLERERGRLTGIAVMILGVLLFVLSRFINEPDFWAGLLLGISVGTMLVDVFVTVRSFVRMERSAPEPEHLNINHAAAEIETPRQIYFWVKLGTV